MGAAGDAGEDFGHLRLRLGAGAVQGDVARLTAAAAAGKVVFEPPATFAAAGKMASHGFLVIVIGSLVPGGAQTLSPWSVSTGVHM